MIIRVTCLLLLLFLISAAIVGCGWGQYADNTSLGEIAKLTGLRFPSSSKLVHGQNRSFEDSDLVAKIRINITELNKFIASLPPNRSVSRTDRLFIGNRTYSDVKWWNPDSSQRFIAIKAKGRHHAEQFNILIDLDDPQFAIVYLNWGKD